MSPEAAQSMTLRLAAGYPQLVAQPDDWEPTPAFCREIVAWICAEFYPPTCELLRVAEHGYPDEEDK